LSCFHMFPYVSTFFQYVTKKHLPCLAPILEVSEMCSTGWAFFFGPDWSGWRIFICMILHACNMWHVYQYVYSGIYILCYMVYI
jgi:hypothetical protein